MLGQSLLPSIKAGIGSSSDRIEMERDGHDQIHFNVRKMSFDTFSQATLSIG